MALIAGGAAEARNVPGSAAAVSLGVAEEAAGMLIDDIGAAVSQMRGQSCAGSGPVVSAAMDGDEVTGLSGLGAGLEGTELASGLRFRGIEGDDYRYDLTTGFVLGAHCIDSRLLAFGGIVFERGDGEIDFSDGTIDHSGGGLTFGLDYAPDDRLSASAIVGHMWLDYDFTRNDGTIRGSFEAERSFVNLSGNYRVDSGMLATDVSGGLRYVSQTNDAHRDSDGNAVAETRAEVLSAVLGARTTIGLGGSVDPFVEVDLRRNLSSSDNLPEVLDDFGADSTHARLGLGFVGRGTGTQFEGGVGANFDGGSYSGMDGYLRLTLRF